MNPLSSDTIHYDATSKVFNEKSRRFGLEEEWAETEFRRRVAAKLSGKIIADDGSPIIRSLGIGSGEGKIEQSFLKQILANGQRIDHVVVEPSHDCIGLYKAEVESAPSSISRIHFEWHEKTLAQFRRHCDGNSQTFDFIAAVHSLYYLEDAEETIQFLYDSLNIGGILMISLTEGYADRRSLAEIPELRNMYVEDNLVYLSDVKKVLDDTGIDYECIFRSVPVDITEVFDEASKEGNLLLNFLTHVVHFRKSVRLDLAKRVLEFLETLAKETTNNDMTSGKNMNKRMNTDQLIISEEWEVLLITKKDNKY